MIPTIASGLHLHEVPARDRFFNISFLSNPRALRYLILSAIARVVEWQTRTFEGRMP